MNKQASIIIPNYNQSEHLHRSISSAYQQAKNYPNIEVIFIDDGSTDNSIKTAQELIGKYNEGIPTQVITKDNGGTASARNAGIMAANGDVLFFLDGDDAYHPLKVAKTMAAIEKFNGIISQAVGVVYTDYVEHFTKDNTSRLMFKPAFDKSLLFHQCIVSTNSAVPSYVFDKLGLFDESIKGCEDYDMWMRIAFEGNYIGIHIPVPLFTYYNHKDSKTNTFDMNKWAAEEQKIRQKVKDLVSI